MSSDPCTPRPSKTCQAWAVLERALNNINAARELFKCAVKADPRSTPSWLVRAL